jgi:hypothetical protein
VTVRLDQLQAGKAVVQEDLLSQRHPFLASVALEFPLVFGELISFDEPVFPEDVQPVLDELAHLAIHPLGPPQDSEANLPARHVEAGKEEGIERGMILDFPGDGMHELVENLFVTLSRGVEEGVEAALRGHGMGHSTDARLGETKEGWHGELPRHPFFEA